MNQQDMPSGWKLEELRKKLICILPSMTSFERDVLTMRFGLKDNYCHTQEEVGLYFNIGKERIRQIEAKSLIHIKHLNKSREKIYEILNSLPSFDQKIIRLKYGLNSGIDMTDQELMEEFKYDKLTQEDIKHTVEKLERRLSHIPKGLSKIKA